MNKYIELFNRVCYNVFSLGGGVIMGNEVFAERICQLRKSKDWTLERLGNEVGLGKTTVLNWEKSGSVPNEEVLRKLSSLFEVPIDYLLGNDEMMNDSENILFRNWGKMSDGDKEMVNQMIEIILKNKNEKR